ncbi:MAG: divergent polysaccharide deacetylase family protein [Desulfovibrio sp.]|jgi:polysaccharide deacetylase 2 family uncharacterized protein YibQ|nr:divergent polysaccharide deacetylase family protein [Desulfovibrio sp.]
MAAPAEKSGKGGKSPGKKARKKTSRKKKGSHAPVILAFLAGLLFAGSGVLLFNRFYFRDAADPSAFLSRLPAAVAPETPSAQQGPAERKISAVPASAGKTTGAAEPWAAPARNAARGSAPEHQAVTGQTKLPRGLRIPSDEPEIPRRRLGPASPSTAELDAEKSVAAALADLQSLPFEEAGTLDSAPPPLLRQPAAPDAAGGRLCKAEARLCIVMDDLGAKRLPTQSLLALDYPVTLAFWPHGPFTREGAEAAAAAGREVLIHQPMEPLGYPGVRPGPNVLLTGMDPDRIRAVLTSSLAAVPHASGLNNHMGSRFTRSAAGVDSVIEFLRAHKLFMLDSVTHPDSVFAAEGRRLGLEHYRRDVFLDVVHSRAAVMEALRKAESLALRNGRAVAIGHPLPETMDALKEFERTRDKKIRIVRLRDLNR